MRFSANFLLILNFYTGQRIRPKRMWRLNVLGCDTGLPARLQILHLLQGKSLIIGKQGHSVTLKHMWGGSVHDSTSCCRGSAWSLNSSLASITTYYPSRAVGLLCSTVNFYTGQRIRPKRMWRLNVLGCDTGLPARLQILHLLQGKSLIIGKQGHSVTLKHMWGGSVHDSTSCCRGSAWSLNSSLASITTYYPSRAVGLLCNTVKSKSIQ